MRTQPVGGGWLATCDCGWSTYSTTRAVVEQRGKRHLCGGES